VTSDEYDLNDGNIQRGLLYRMAQRRLALSPSRFLHQML